MLICCMKSTVPLQGLSSSHHCKGIDWVVVLHLAGRQLRFPLYSGYGCIPLLSPVSCSVEYPMPYASCLVSCSVSWRCSLQLCLSDVPCLMQLSLSKVWGFCSLFYLGYFGIALWDSLSGLCGLWYSLSSFSSL